MSQSVINAQYAYVGVGSDTHEALTFSELNFSVEGLDEWLSIRGITVENHFDVDRDRMQATIRYNQPENIQIQLPPDIDLTFRSRMSMTSAGSHVTEATIKQKAYISLRSRVPKPVEGFLALIQKITHFLGFAMDTTVSVNALTAYSDELTIEIRKGKKHRVPVEIYYSSTATSEVKPPVRGHHMLFQYEQIAHELQKMMTNWLTHYESAEPAFNAYFASPRDAYHYLDGRFLSLVQGIEILHRRHSDTTAMPEPEFAQLVTTILESCPTDKQKWLKERLMDGNDLLLRERLADLLEPFQRSYGSSRDTETFLSAVIETRHALIHHDKGLSEKGLTGTDLWKLCRQLEGLFQLHVLRLTGLTVEHINRLANDNHALGEKLNDN